MSSAHHLNESRGQCPSSSSLRADHDAAVLVFELANRAYFAASISDRGDAFFEQFAERHSASLAEQDAGVGAYYVLVADDDSILGRFNLYFVGDDTANLGYRVAQHDGRPRRGDRDRRGVVATGGREPRPAHAQGGHRQRECPVPRGY